MLVVSARQGGKDRVRALDFGADDFLNKPYYPEELLARGFLPELKDCLELGARVVRVEQSSGGGGSITDLPIRFSSYPSWVQGAVESGVRAAAKVHVGVGH